MYSKENRLILPVKQIILLVLNRIVYFCRLKRKHHIFCLSVLKNFILEKVSDIVEYLSTGP